MSPLSHEAWTGQVQLGVTYRLIFFVTSGNNGLLPLSFAVTTNNDNGPANNGPATTDRLSDESWGDHSVPHDSSVQHGPDRVEWGARSLA
jgi:hypothetical protein